MSHATIYADQERVLSFIDGRLSAGAADHDVIRACRSVDALAEVGHPITGEDLRAATTYLAGMTGLEQDVRGVHRDVDHIALIRRVMLPKSIPTQSPVHR